MPELFSFRDKKRFWVVSCCALLALILCPKQILAQRPLGVDVSSYQTGINWTSVKGAGITFAWAKATEGLTLNDTQFIYNETNGKAAGVLIGAYHFGHPESHADRAGADQEADHFWSIAKNYITNGQAYLMPVLDVETFTNTATYMSDWANEWCQRIVNYAASNGVTIQPLIYISSGHAKTWYNSTVPQWGSWIAEWPSSPNPATGAPSSNVPWPTWNFWQYFNSGTYPGITDTNYDVDVYNGTVTNLINSWVIGGYTNRSPSFTATQSTRYADRGGSLTLRASADGSVPLKYQWVFNGANISGATASTLKLSNIQTTNAGSYTVVVTNVNGSITSSVAAVTVNALYTSVFNDNFETNSSTNWLVSQTTDTRAIFAYDYSLIGVPSAPNSAGGTTKGLRMEANLSSGTVSALSASPLGKVFGGTYRLHFDMWINVNGPLPGGGTGSTEFVTAGVGTLGNRVQWNGSGTTADGVWFLVDGDGGVGDTSTSFGDYLAYVGTTQQAVGSGVYTAGTQTTARANADAYYANIFPAGKMAPDFQRTNYSQEVGPLAIGSVGLAWRDVVISKGASTVDWYIDGLKIASAPVASITASNIFVGYLDEFTSISDNTNLSFGLVDNLRVEVPVVAPGISAQTGSLTVAQGSNVTFTVTASGTPAPAYQWLFNGANISGATASNYTKVNAQLSDAGSYSVAVTNIGGTFTSSNTVLTVIVPPVITTNPQPQTVNQSSNVTFTVSAAGTTPLNYQWRKNGGAIGGATLNSFSLVNVTSTDAASYSVVVTNFAGSMTSSPAILTVVIPPTVVAGPSNLTVNVGADAAFSVQTTGTIGIYQWRKNGGAIGGATTASYALSNVALGDAGNYSVVVTNTAGAATSSDAALTVVTIQFKNARWATDRSGFQFDLTGAPGRNYKLDVATNILGWNTLATLTNETGTISYKDTTATNSNASFQLYRASTSK